MHHPFTAPVEEDLAFLESEPARVRAKAYDLVLNGVEVGGGSIRIHDMDLQRRIFKALGLSDAETETKFGYFLEALELRRAAPRRHRLRLRPPGHAAGRRGVDPRSHRLPQDDNRPRPDDGLAVRSRRAPARRPRAEAPLTERTNGLMKDFRRARLISLALWAVILSAPAASAAPAPRAWERKSLTATASREAIKIDGVLSEDVWTVPGSTGFTQIDPLDGRPATEETTVWIAFDRNNLYVAARLADRDPAGIVSRLGRRDELVDSDWFYFGIDPYLDRRSGYFFAVNPAGSIFDGTFFNDEATDTTWDGIWESATRMDERGWTVEMRIPFDQLRFKRRGSLHLGRQFPARHQAQERDRHLLLASEGGERDGFPLRRPQRDPGHRAGEPARALPYVSGKGLFSPAEPGNPFRTGHDYSGNAGFDFKAGLKSDLTLDLSVNPDFGQVEVDPAVINISDQETYYQEKRPFFIEGSSIFNFGRGGPNTARSAGWTDPGFFYSRRIGRQPQGSPGGLGPADVPEWTTILGAAKITGKIGPNFSLGFVNAVTANESAEIALSGVPGTRDVPVEPLTYYGVVRGLREFGDGRSGLGFIATSVLRDFPAGRRSTPGSTARPTPWASTAGRSWTRTGSGRFRAGRAGRSSAEARRRSPGSSDRPSIISSGPTSITSTSTRTRRRSRAGPAGSSSTSRRGISSSTRAWRAMSPGFEANDLGYHTRGDVINGHVQAGYRTFHPGPLFRHWNATLTYYQNYDFGGHRIGEYWILDGEAPAPELLDGRPPHRTTSRPRQPLPDPGRPDGLLSVGGDDRGRFIHGRPEDARLQDQRQLPQPSSGRTTGPSRAG